ncbi:MAG: HNH endonuclease domain-containing protein [Coriobacteriales bacterium]|jgi:hypothetical protein
MVAAAWYPVTYFRLNLGASDVLTKVVQCAQERCGLAADTKYDDIVAAVLESDDRELRAKVRGLYSYVPYRLIRPFYTERLDEARGGGKRLPDALVNGLVLDFNREDTAGAPYRFNDDGDGIEVDPEWARYFVDNRHVVQGWLDSKLVTYLQERNPSVPAIPLKIYAPAARKLTDARRYWEEALRDHVFTDIYSGVPFDEGGFAAHGPMSVDHFIPWSFVLHDEPWNLAPMFRDANSSKGDRLPVLDEYLRSFCEQQFDAIITLRDTGRHKKIFESYAQVDEQVMRYERTDAALDSFTESVTKVIVPLHQIAANQGFPVWRPSVEYAVVQL